MIPSLGTTATLFFAGVRFCTIAFARWWAQKSSLVSLLPLQICNARRSHTNAPHHAGDSRQICQFATHRITAPLPDGINGHFGSELRRFALGERCTYEQFLTVLNEINSLTRTVDQEVCGSSPPNCTSKIKHLGQATPDLESP